MSHLKMPCDFNGPNLEQFMSQKPEDICKMYNIEKMDDDLTVSLNRDQDDSFQFDTKSKTKSHIQQDQIINE